MEGNVVGPVGSWYVIIWLQRNIIFVMKRYERKIYILKLCIFNETIEKHGV